MRSLLVFLVALVLCIPPISPARAGTEKFQDCSASSAMAGLTKFRAHPFPAAGNEGVAAPTEPAKTAAPPGKLIITDLSARVSPNESCMTARTVHLRVRTALLNVGKPDSVLKNARVTCGLFATPSRAGVPQLRAPNVKLGTVAFTFHFVDLAFGEQGVSTVPAPVTAEPQLEDFSNGDAIVKDFVAGAHLGGCTTAFNADDTGSSDERSCNDAAAMQNLTALEGHGFPSGGTQANVSNAGLGGIAAPPDAQLTITKIDVSTTDGSCSEAHNIRVRLRVAALNTSSDAQFVLQRARVVCGLYVQPLPGLKGRTGLENDNVKISSMNFDFVFLNVHRGELGLSLFSTGDEKDPRTSFTIQGEATSSDFVPKATLGGCSERFNA
jgi:hypothetical protein